ncbi:energy transducer TonB [Halobacteriovorax sp. HLS]|uniref:energy transducer TonB family protein n=1 Tax=Halobacteriovorax sp. HLS TaxID=2234000 RepID=UPI000FD6E3BD|nr:energy transducer TonB [Halobacteriovorax sp. HLS]
MIENKTNKDKDNFKKLLFLPIVVSILFHGAFLISRIDLKKSPLVKVSESTPKKIKLKLRKSKTKPMQIVNSELKKVKEDPKDAKYLSKQNQKVDRETKAATTGSFKSAGKGIRTGSKEASQSVVQSSKGKSNETKKVAAKKTKTKKFDPKNIKLTDLGLGSTFTKKPASKSAPKLGLKNGQIKAFGLAQNNDFIEDLPLGDMTKLNTIEYKYYGFYFRIRQKLEQHWGDSLRKQAKKMWKKGRSIASDENKITSLTITIDKSGNITEVKVKSTSGINELDDAAIESFNKAGPFPNPPSDLVKNGYAKIEWGFVVKS